MIYYISPQLTPDPLLFPQALTLFLQRSPHQRRFFHHLLLLLQLSFFQLYSTKSWRRFSCSSYNWHFYFTLATQFLALILLLLPFFSNSGRTIPSVAPVIASSVDSFSGSFQTISDVISVSVINLSNSVQSTSDAYSVISPPVGIFSNSLQSISDVLLQCFLHQLTFYLQGSGLVDHW